MKILTHLDNVWEEMEEAEGEYGGRERRLEKIFDHQTHLDNGSHLAIARRDWESESGGRERRLVKILDHQTQSRQRFHRVLREFHHFHNTQLQNLHIFGPLSSSPGADPGRRQEC